MAEQDGRMVPVHVNRGDGRCEWIGVPESTIGELVRRADEAKAARAEEMPDTEAALAVLHRAYVRLKELGWSDAIYCPKDGTLFLAIEAGSTGQHQCHYGGEWPDGIWWIDDGDTWPSRPILWRPIDRTDSPA